MNDKYDILRENAEAKYIEENAKFSIGDEVIVIRTNEKGIVRNIEFINIDLDDIYNKIMYFVDTNDFKNLPFYESELTIPTSNKPKFKITDKVIIKANGKIGVVANIRSSEHVHEFLYFVDFKDNDKISRLVFTEDELEFENLNNIDKNQSELTSKPF